MPARPHAPQPAEPERLQKYLARAGIASRRHAEELIVAGAVTINGHVARELGTRVDPRRDEVRVRGRLVRPQQTLLYLLQNKPTGTMTTASDPEGRRTVLDLLPPEWRTQRVYPVGRLDYDTSGVLLLTNDGDLALRLSHPRYALAKVYHALVEEQPTPEMLQRLERGMSLQGEMRPTAPARAWIVGTGKRGGSWLALEIHEGRNRQVRRMLEELGLPVLQLRRVRVGPLTLGGLAPGATRALTPDEVAALRAAVDLRD